MNDRWNLTSRSDMSVSDAGVASDIDHLWTWSEAIEEDTASVSPSSLFRTDSTFWSGNFLPPPPRPAYLENQISSDGLTTCDLCSWALQHYSQTRPQSHSEVGFSFSYNLFVTLSIVSLLSALLGAVIMIVLINFKGRCGLSRSHIQCTKGDIHAEFNITRTFFCLGRRKRRRLSVPMCNANVSANKNVDDGCPETSCETPKSRFSWFTSNRNRRRTPPLQLLTTSVKSMPASNHYTVDGETYTSVIDEAVYSELDRIPSHTYQNSDYAVNNDAIFSSAPSSAYYSDISNGGGAYEMVGHVSTNTNITPPCVVWSARNIDSRVTRIPGSARQSCILEGNSTASNYI